MGSEALARDCDEAVQRGVCVTGSDIVEANSLLQDTVCPHLPGAAQDPTVSLAAVGALKNKRVSGLDSFRGFGP